MIKQVKAEKYGVIKKQKYNFNKGKFDALKPLRINRNRT